MEIKEQRINLGDLLKKVLRQWKVVIFCTVFLGVCFPVIRYALDVKAQKERIESASAEESTVASSAITEEENLGVKNALLVYRSLQQRREYLENSVLMQIDPLVEPVSSTQYMIESEDHSGLIASSLLDFVQQGGYYNHIEGQWKEEISEAYMLELISGEVIAQQNASQTIIRIDTVADSAETAREINDAIAEAMEQFGAELQKTIGAHTLTKIITTDGVQVDKALMQNQDTLYSEIRNYQTGLADLMKGFSAQQKELFESTISDKAAFGDQEQETWTLSQEIEDTEVSDHDDPAETTLEFPEVRVSLKDIALGLGLGFLIGVVISVLRYVFGGKLHRAEDIRYGTGMPVLMELGKESRWENRERLLRVRIAYACKQDQVSRLVLGTTGTLSDGEKDLAEKMKEMLSEEGVSCLIEEQLLENPAGLSELADSAFLLLLERLEKSRYKDVCALAGTCAEMHVHCIGAVLTD